MLCDKCKKNNSTVHYRYNDNGHITEIHMCSECAKKEGLFKNDGSVLSGFFSNHFIDSNSVNIPFSSIFSDGFASDSKIKGARVCPGCGLSENELLKKGKFGCEKCYSVFSDAVNVMLNKLHMSTKYMGRVPEKIEIETSLRSKIDKLKAEMQNAVDKQEYEEAAKIRDMIYDLEKEASKTNDGGENNEMV